MGPTLDIQLLVLTAPCCSSAVTSSSIREAVRSTTA